VSHAAVLGHGGLVGKPIPVDETFADLGVDHEVADATRGEVLEKVGSLRGCNPEISKPSRDNDPYSGNLISRHRYPEKGIARSPAADPHEQVRTLLCGEVAIAASDGGRNVSAFETIKAMENDDDVSWSPVISLKLNRVLYRPPRSAKCDAWAEKAG
jgi:hypothetical protein